MRYYYIGSNINIEQIGEIKKYLQRSGMNGFFINSLNELEYILLRDHVDVATGYKRDRRLPPEKMILPFSVRVKPKFGVETKLRDRESKALIEAMIAIGVNTPYNKQMQENGRVYQKSPLVASVKQK